MWTAKKGRLEGEAGGESPGGKQWGTERKVLGVHWNEGKAAQWETPTRFPAKPSLFICLHSGQSTLLPGRLCSQFSGLWSQKTWSIPCHQPQEKSHKHHFNPNISFITTEAIRFPRDEWACQLHSPIPKSVLQGTLSLAKVCLLSAPPALHTSPAHISPPQHQCAAPEITHHTAQWAQSPCFLAASTG